MVDARGAAPSANSMPLHRQDRSYLRRMRSFICCRVRHSPPPLPIDGMASATTRKEARREAGLRVRRGSPRLESARTNYNQGCAASALTRRSARDEPKPVVMS